MAPHLRALCCVAFAGIVVSCTDAGGCGGDATYVYPTTPEAAPTPQAMRARITQSGLDAIAAGVGPLLAAGCVGNKTDGTDSCAIDTNPAFHHACDGVCDPTFDTACLEVCDLSVDPTCDPACECAPGCDPNPRVRFYLGDPSMSPSSYLAIDVNTLQPNLHISLVQDAQGGGVQVTIGCNEAQFSNCNDPSEFVTGSLDMVIYSLPGVACWVNEDAPPGFTIESMRFIMRPSIEPGVDDKPFLVMENADITVSRMKPELNITVGKATWDPACEQNVPFLGDVCNAGCVVLDGFGAVAEFLFETGFIAEILADQIAGMVLDSFTKDALQMEGALDIAALLPTSNSHANPTGFLFAGTIADLSASPPIFSPNVTGSTGNLGWNFDFDVGFAGDSSRCVPPINAPSFALPLPPDVDSTVMAPDPVTGDLVSEPYDLVLLLGDVVLQRAVFELFDTGTLCLNLDGEAMAPLTGGSFVPTVATLNLIADGLSDLAPDNAPVDIMVMPRLPMDLDFGTGELDSATGEVDSHFNILWPDLWVEFYPLVDDVSMRSTAFSLDLDIGVSLVPAPNGNLGLLIDRITTPRVVDMDPEALAPLDTAGLQMLVGVLLDVLISDEPIDIALTADAVGLPFVPKIRAVNQLGQNGEFLGIFLRFCNAEALADPLNALCNEDSSAGGGGGNEVDAGSLGVELISGPQPGRSDLRVAAFSNVAPIEILELAYHVDGGPWFNFRGADTEGLFTLSHPRLAVPGNHTLSVVARHPGRPAAWSNIATLELATATALDVGGSSDAVLAIDPAHAECRGPGAGHKLADGGCSATTLPTPLSLLCLLPGVALARRRRTRRAR